MPEMRASTLAARALCLEPRYTRVPCVGGTEGESLVPLFSKAVEYFDFAKVNFSLTKPDKDNRRITKSVKSVRIIRAILRILRRNDMWNVITRALDLKGDLLQISSYTNITLGGFLTYYF